MEQKYRQSAQIFGGSSDGDGGRKVGGGGSGVGGGDGRGQRRRLCPLHRNRDSVHCTRSAAKTMSVAAAAATLAVAAAIGDGGGPGVVGGLLGNSIRTERARKRIGVGRGTRPGSGRSRARAPVPGRSGFRRLRVSPVTESHATNCIECIE